MGNFSHTAAMFNHKRAKELVAASRLKKSVIASDSSIKEATLSKYLNGDGHPSPAVIRLLASSLGVHESELTIKEQTQSKAS